MIFKKKRSDSLKLDYNANLKCDWYKIMQLISSSQIKSFYS